jgi:glycogen synthase
VLFPGFLRGHDLHEAYAAADVFVMPSVSEPFGIAALEAMRVGTPVVLSSQSGVAEAAPDALSADFWDAPQLAKLIHQILNDSSLHARLSENGRNAAARLSWDRAGASVRSIMDEVAHA